MIKNCTFREKTEGLNRIQKGQIRLILVDDDQDVLTIIKSCLEMHGFQGIGLSQSAKEAMKKIKSGNFDVIVSDHKMPQLDGLSFLKELKKNGCSNPFILFTGETDEEISSQALRLGAFDCLSKHGDPETVYGELASCIIKASCHTKNEKCEKTKIKEMLHENFDNSVFSDLEIKLILECHNQAVKLVDQTKEALARRLWHITFSSESWERKSKRKIGEMIYQKQNLQTRTSH